MTRVIRNIVLFAACAFATVLPVDRAHAHFLWLKTLAVPDGKPQAFLFFGENAADEAYHFPEKLASVKIFRRAADGKRAELKTESLDTDDRVGHVSQLESDDACVL